MIAEVVMHFGDEWGDLLLIIFGAVLGACMCTVVQMELNNRKKKK
jgi:hypothetical protein